MIYSKNVLSNKIIFFDYTNSNSPSFHLFLISINLKKVKKSKIF